MTFTSSYVNPGNINYNPNMPGGLPGMLEGFGQARIYPYVNNVGTVDTFTVTSPATVDPDAAYNVVLSATSLFSDVTVSVETSAAPTTTDLATALFNSMRTNAEFYSMFDVAIDSVTDVITLTARSVGEVLSVSVPGTLTNPLVVAKTVNTTKSGIVPFGRFVGRLPTYFVDKFSSFGQASVINNASGFEILGVSQSSHFTEKQGIFEDALAGYKFGSTMSVVEDTGTYKGIYVVTVEPDIARGEAVYLAVDPGNEGKLTRNSTGNIDVSSLVKVRIGSQRSFGDSIALVTYTGLPATI